NQLEAPLRALGFSRGRWLALLLTSRTKISERFRFQDKPRRNGACILAAVKTYAGPRTLKQHRHGHHRFFQRSKTQVPGVTPKLISHDDLFVLSDDVAL